LILQLNKNITTFTQHSLLTVSFPIPPFQAQSSRSTGGTLVLPNDSINAPVIVLGWNHTAPVSKDVENSRIRVCVAFPSKIPQSPGPAHYTAYAMPNLFLQALTSKTAFLHNRYTPRPPEHFLSSTFRNRTYKDHLKLAMAAVQELPSNGTKGAKNTGFPEPLSEGKYIPASARCH
jgi:hypothetical protein